MAVSREAREGIADWLIVIGSVLLAGSLFLTWSHQLSRSVLSAYGHSQLLRGVPADPTAWQVYSVMDVALGLLAVGLFAVALIGARGARVVALAGCSIGFAFTVHALSDPPTNHAVIFDPALGAPGYIRDPAGAGVGETLAIMALASAIAGLGLSFTAD